MTGMTLAPSAPPATEPERRAPHHAAIPHRVRMTAAAVWQLAPGRYLAIPDGHDVIVIALGQVTRIGRHTSADIVLDDCTVSLRHALVLDRGGVPVIADDRSRGGVYVNGRRVREAPLCHGDDVQLGDRVMRYLEV
jgi:pSer/pThr/pTyr-binding forkhead associated (FHA) protein